MTESISTVGHSNRSGDEFAALLVAAGIETVVDVRSIPRSRWPQFNSLQLQDLLSTAGIDYEARGKNLGGKGGNVDFEATIEEMAARAAEGEQIALLCSEGKFRECHRYTMLTPPLLALGVQVRHLNWDGTVTVQEPGDAPVHRGKTAPLF